MLMFDLMKLLWWLLIIKFQRVVFIGMGIIVQADRALEYYGQFRWCGTFLSVPSFLQLNSHPNKVILRIT